MQKIYHVMKSRTRSVTMGCLLTLSMLCLTFTAGAAENSTDDSARELDKQVGQPADIAGSAYQYRADRKPDENAPESWLAVMRFAGQPLNKPAEITAPKVKKVLSALLWEEIRPVQQVELIWPADTKRWPTPEEVVITTLDSQGSASSWWNNLTPVAKAAKPTISADGMTWVYDLKTPTCGIVISVKGAKTAADVDVPKVRVLVADVWKKMEVEVEWAFDKATADKDYSGRIETYDGKMAALHSLEGNDQTKVIDEKTWQSDGKGAGRRGIKFNLLYIGTSKWRKVVPFTSQSDDIARTIVTLWTKSGNFSFRAADLNNGPILAPEYGFFVRRIGQPEISETSKDKDALKATPLPLLTKMESIAGDSQIKGWGSDNTPWFGANPTDKTRSPLGVALPAGCAAMHPGPSVNVVAEWRSPVSAKIQLSGGISHAQPGGQGVEWWVVVDSKEKRKILNQGVTDGTHPSSISTKSQAPGDGKAAGDTAGDTGSPIAPFDVEAGDRVSLVVGPKGSYQGCAVIVDLSLTEIGGTRVWNLAKDVAKNPIEGNPHSDSLGNRDVWRFCSEMPMFPHGNLPSDPPIQEASNAASARDFEKELASKGLLTIREQIRNHDEQTWEAAVTAMCGPNLPPHPTPPAGSEPSMKVEVPSERLTAQWNLGAWHLVRHCEKNPDTGRLWFNDYPYGILGAETYMVLAALDKMGSNSAAADGFDQWLSLPTHPHNGREQGQTGGALLDRPTGLFSDGTGCLTHAVGPPGAGGHMDSVHAFGPGSIGWALVEHYRLTGDREWFKAAAPAIEGNVEWMLRQRQVVKNMVPGGERLWCKGLTPALQVTPDSGGLWLQFYECQAYYWVAVQHFAEALSTIDPAEGAKLTAEAEEFRKDLRAAVDRSIALSPVVPVRDGTYHSVVPFACYVRGLATDAWGWMREGSGGHVGPLYWDTVQSAAALISPAGLLPADDVRVQGYLDVLEDRLLFENEYVSQRDHGDWFFAGWQYQGGLERTSNMHLAGDDIPVFLRSFLNGYAIDIIPDGGYTFNEHAVHGPPDKIYEESAFLERFRNLLVMEDGQNLWLARATPRVWLEQGKKISVTNAPTYFGTVDYEIVSDVDHGKINAKVKMPSRDNGDKTNEVWLRLRHPKSEPIQSVTVNGKSWKDFDAAKEIVRLHDLKETATVEVNYAR